MKIVCTLSLLAGLLLWNLPIAAGQGVGFNFFNPVNKHHYRLVSVPQRTWDEARLIAEAMNFGGVNGHLATITSAEEQDFLEGQLSLSLSPNTWIGGFQPAGSPEPAGNWQWVTGEPFTYANWLSPGEPNNNGNENRIELFQGVVWNDVGDADMFNMPNRRAFLVEFPTPEPSAAMLELVGIASLLGAMRRRSR